MGLQALIIKVLFGFPFWWLYHVFAWAVCFSILFSTFCALLVGCYFAGIIKLVAIVVSDYMDDTGKGKLVHRDMRRLWSTGVITVMTDWMPMLATLVNTEIVVYYTSPKQAFHLSLVIAIYTGLACWVNSKMDHSKASFCCFLTFFRMGHVYAVMKWLNLKLTGCHPITGEAFICESFYVRECDKDKFSEEYLPHPHPHPNLKPSAVELDLDLAALMSYEMVFKGCWVSNWVINKCYTLNVKASCDCETGLFEVEMVRKNKFEFFRRRLRILDEEVIRKRVKMDLRKMQLLKQVFDGLVQGEAICRSFSSYGYGNCYNLIETVDIIASGECLTRCQFAGCPRWICGAQVLKAGNGLVKT